MFGFSSVAQEEPPTSGLPDFTGSAIVVISPNPGFPSGCGFASEVHFIHNYPGQNKYFIQFLGADCPINSSDIILIKRHITARVTTDGSVVFNIKSLGVARLIPDPQYLEEIKTLYPLREVSIRTVEVQLLGHQVVFALHDPNRPEI